MIARCGSALGFHEYAIGCKRHWGLEVMGLVVCLCFLWNGIGVLLDMPIPHSTSFSIPHALICYCLQVVIFEKIEKSNAYYTIFKFD